MIRDLLCKRYRQKSLEQIVTVGTVVIVTVTIILESSHPRCTVEKGILKIFTNFTGKYQSWSLSLLKLQD